MKFAIFTKTDKDVSKQYQMVEQAAKNASFTFDNENPDVVFVLGGDGTLLKAVQRYIDIVDNIKFVGFRCGNLGFFYDFNEEDIDRVINELGKNEFIERTYHLLECEIDDKKVYAVNEIRFERPFHSVSCVVSVNNEELESFRGDGLVVSSVLGSSGYSKSIGGAVIDHSIEVLQLNEIAAIQNNLYKSIGSPLLLNKESVISFKGKLNNILLGYDHKIIECQEVNTIKVKYSAKKICLVFDKKHNGLTSIRRSFVK